MGRHSSTQAVHAGEDRRKPHGALTTAIVQSSTYTFENTAEILDFMQRKAVGSWPVRHEYGRYSNPTQSAVERKLAALDGGEQALLFASGMAAITTTMLALLSQGEHMVMFSDCYRRTREFGTGYLPRWGIETTLVSMDEPSALAGAIRPNTRLVFAEMPTNPYLRIVDLRHLVETAQKHSVVSMIDSTFATPINLRPLEFGVDLVMHSATKYLGGHNDLLAGAVIGSHRLLSAIERARGVFGGVSSPHDAYLLLRGLKTLDLRLRRHNETGQRVAEFLERHPAVRRVHYPGLSSHPDHALAQRQMSGFGGVVSFELRADLEGTAHFVDRLRLPYIGPTLGGVESVVEQPAVLFSLNPTESAAAGLKENLVRYALGIEDPEDVVEDLAQALEALRT